MPGVVLLKGIQSGLLLLLLSHFSCVRLRATPGTAAHQAPLSLGFSRQEYRNGLPFPSPMHACMLSRFSCVQLCVTLWTAAHRLLCPWDSPCKNTGVGCHFLLQCMHAKLLQSCPTLCEPTDGSPPGSSVHGTLRQEYWSALPFPSPFER